MISTEEDDLARFSPVLMLLSLPREPTRVAAFAMCLIRCVSAGGGQRVGAKEDTESLILGPLVENGGWRNFERRVARLS